MIVPKAAIGMPIMKWIAQNGSIPLARETRELEPTGRKIMADRILKNPMNLLYGARQETKTTEETRALFR